MPECAPCVGPENTWHARAEAEGIGRFGTFVLFLALFVGVLGFVLKNVLVEFFLLG